MKARVVRFEGRFYKLGTGGGRVVPHEISPGDAGLALARPVKSMPKSRAAPASRKPRGSSSLLAAGAFAAAAGGVFLLWRLVRPGGA